MENQDDIREHGMEKETARKCILCGAKIASGEVCENCKREYEIPERPPRERGEAEIKYESERRDGIISIIFSILLPIAGFIFGICFTVKNEEKLEPIIAIVLSVVFSGIYYLIYLALFQELFD